VGFVRGPAGTDPQGVFSLKVDLLRGVRIIRQADLSVRVLRMLDTQPEKVPEVRLCGGLSTGADKSHRSSLNSMRQSVVLSVSDPVT